MAVRRCRFRVDWGNRTQNRMRHADSYYKVLPTTIILAVDQSGGTLGGALSRPAGGALVTPVTAWAV